MSKSFFNLREMNRLQRYLRHILYLEGEIDRKAVLLRNAMSYGLHSDQIVFHIELAMYKEASQEQPKNNE